MQGRVVLPSWYVLRAAGLVHVHVLIIVRMLGVSRMLVWEAQER